MWPVSFAFLAVPLWHVVHGYNWHMRVLWIFRPNIRVPVTGHELLHALQPFWLRLATNLGWLACLAGVIIFMIWPTRG